MPLTELKAVGGIFILYDSCLWRPAGRSKHFFTRKAPSKQCILTVNAMDHRGPSCEKRSPENPQILRASLITNNFSAKNSHSARGGYSKSKIKRSLLPMFEGPPSVPGYGTSAPRPP